MSKLPQIHGHRGARGQAPENTLIAAQCALFKATYELKEADEDFFENL